MLTDVLELIRCGLLIVGIACDTTINCHFCFCQSNVVYYKVLLRKTLCLLGCCMHCYNGWPLTYIRVQDEYKSFLPVWRHEMKENKIIKCPNYKVRV